jgi:hypothetical protein
VAPPLESRSPLPAIFSDTDRGADDVLTLVEQLDMATSTFARRAKRWSGCASLLQARSEKWLRQSLPPLRTRHASLVRHST